MLREWSLVLLLSAGAWADNSVKAPPKGAVPVYLSTISFDHDAAGKPPANFSFAVTGEGPEMHWEIQQDPLVTAPHHILVQNGKTDLGDNVAIALLGDRSLQNGEIAVRFRVNSGEDDQSAGIVWRYKDPQTYYMARASAKEDTCSVYRVKKGKMKLIDSNLVVIVPYTWHELRLVFVNKDFTAFVDGELAVGGKDSSYLEAGKIGLCTLSDSTVRFDGLRVSR